MAASQDAAPLGSGTRLQAWLLVLPALALLAAFTYWPVIATLIDSVRSTPQGSHPAVFVGLDNYRAMLADPVFRQALWNNAVYAAITVPVSVVLALLMALAVDAARGARMPGRTLLRLAFFTPTMLPMVAVANIWLFFYTPGYGLFDRIAYMLGLGQPNWLGDASTALPAMIIVAIWKQAGFFMIFYLAALQSIPPNLREAAALEGVSRLSFLRRVTLPLVGPTTLFVVVNAVIDAFRLVDHIVVMTRGGPDNATALLFYYIYVVGFQYWDSGDASALTAILVTGLAALAFLSFRVFGRKVHYR
ncbi:MAG: sugar ABC transporter permease [Rhodospirillales bacterium]|nr:sugar ABC transporter permease [Rhodospirillales bacterium]MDE2200196.1 sugar ABC transporter permease [Rhodospirillales bacterium]MDE2576704.1 sugar ABC transporter permease [Rhodospirillales bacterium]